MGIDGMVEGRRYRVRTRDGFVLSGPLSGRQLVTDPETGKAQWAAVLKDLESATDPGVRGGEAFLLAMDVAAIAELAEGR